MIRKTLIYIIVLMISISFSSFRKECNNDEDQTSLKKDFPQKIIHQKNQPEWSLAPVYNFLEI